MLKILAKDGLWDVEQIRQTVGGLLLAMEREHLIEEDMLALDTDISVNGVALVLAAIEAGPKIALCPEREPSEVINEWLKELGIKKLISSRALEHTAGIRAQRFFSGDLIKSEEFVARTPVCGFRDLLTIIRTSGTGGKPKSALISGCAHRASAHAVSKYFRMSPDSCWALSLPLYHVSGLSILFRCLKASAAIYLAKTHEELCYGLSSQKITHVSLVPAQLKRLLDEGVGCRGVEALVIGGDALSLDLRERALKAGLPLYETYGLTETASMVWVKDCRADEAIILPHAVMRIGEEGEILVGGESLFEGYLGDDGGAKRDLVHGLFQTGDLGELSDLGTLFITGRKSNRIISGGENIQAEEIERALLEHPLIKESVVVGIKDDIFGMRPCAFINWIESPPPDEELIHHLSKRLAPFKIPKMFLPWPADVPQGLKKPRQWFVRTLQGLSLSNYS